MPAQAMFQEIKSNHHEQLGASWTHLTTITLRCQRLLRRSEDHGGSASWRSHRV